MMVCLTAAQALNTSILASADSSEFCKGEKRMIKQQIKDLKDEENKLPKQRLNELYNDILQLQTGEQDEERIDIGKSNNDFLSWAIYFDHDGHCIIEDERTVGSLEKPFAKELNNRKRLRKALDRLFSYRVD